MARLATQILQSDLRSLADAFLTWWLGELRALVPARLAQALAAPRPTLRLDLGPSVVIRRVADGREHAVGQIAGDDPAALGAVLAQLGTEDRATGVVVRLPPDQVLRRRLELPLATARELRPLIGFELERQTPLTAEQAYFDCRVLRRDRAARRMIVALAVARREVVDRAARSVTDWGVAVDSVGVQAMAGEDWAISLLPRPPAGLDQRRRRLALAGLAGLALVLGAALLFADGARADRNAAILQARLAEARKAADATGALRNRADALTAETRFLPVLRQTHSPARMLNDLARALPDGTWLTGLAIDGTALRLDGQSADAAGLIDRLDAVAGFADAHFTAPLIKESGGGTERFSIALTVQATR